MRHLFHQLISRYLFAVNWKNHVRSLTQTISYRRYKRKHTKKHPKTSSIMVLWITNFGGVSLTLLILKGNFSFSYLLKKILTWKFEDYHILHNVITWQIPIKFWDGSCPGLHHLTWNDPFRFYHLKMFLLIFIEICQEIELISITYVIML